MGFRMLAGGLKRQVILWIILPVTILLIIFTIGGINGYDNAMRTLAVEDEKRLVIALSELLAAQMDKHAIKTGLWRDDVTIDMLKPEEMLHLHHRGIATTLVVFDRSATILYSSGNVPPADKLLEWEGVTEVLRGEADTIIATDSSYDIVAYAPVPHTDWYLIIRESWFSLIDPLIRLDQIMVFVLFAATVISSLTLLFGVRFVVQPLRELGVRAQLIGQGHFEAASKPVGGGKEIEELRQTLNDMAHRVESYQVSLQDYLRAVTTAQEEERARLARELHDVTTQTLIALGHKAQMIQRSLERDNGQTQERITEIRTMIAAAIDEVRHFSQALHPPYLDELGLVTGLEILCKEAGAACTIFGTETRLLPEKELAIYRITQEALNNARRHAQAANIRVELHFSPSRIVLQVSDDGIGFELPSYFNSLTRTGHFGLVGMRERAQLAGGQIEIESASGRGTTVTFSLANMPVSDPVAVV